MFRIPGLRKRSGLAMFLLAGACAALVGPAPLAGQSAPAAGWVLADFHIHTCLTDGEEPFARVMDEAARGGPHFIVNSEHGGAYHRDAHCTPWSERTDVTLAGDPTGDDDAPDMWRWQALVEHAWPELEAARERHSDRMFNLGLEWNPPGTDHASVGIVSDEPWDMATFEYRFDGRSRDTSGAAAGIIEGLDGLEQWNGRASDGSALDAAGQLAHAVEALKWLDTHHRGRAWVLPAHPERASNTSVESLRAWNDAAPHVAFGFEGAPGAQSAPIRGGFRPERAMGGSTLGGVGFMAGRVGGVWDALLGEGRHFWLFASSDFHREAGAFWPGTYTRTHILAADPTRPADVVAGMQAGRVFISHGHLVDDLELRLIHDGAEVGMGGTLDVPPGARPELVLRYRSPERNPAGDRPEVAWISVIRGDVTGRAEPGTPEWSATSNPSTHVEAGRAGPEGASVTDPAGGAPWTEHRWELEPVETDGYVRLRGSNHPPATPLHTDPDGNPLPDAVALSHWLLQRIVFSGEALPDSPEALLAESFAWGAERAWSDLWFYTNPIFVSVVEGR